MKKNTGEFSLDQLKFLAVLEAFSQPVPIEIAGALAPLSPGPLFDLLRRAKKSGWLRQESDDNFLLGTDLPDQLLYKLKKINNRKRLCVLTEKISTSKDLQDQLSQETFLQLLKRAGKKEKAFCLEMDLALKAFKSGEHGKATGYLRSVKNELPLILESAEFDSWYVSTALEIASYCFLSGWGLKEMALILETALEGARRIGDQRQWALINFHLGRIYYFGDRRQEALKVLSAGKEKVEALGDSDIMDQAAEFLAFYYAMHGRFRQSTAYLNQAFQSIESWEKEIAGSFIPVILGYHEAYLGQFHRAVGILDSHWHRAKRSKNSNVAMITRAVLGTVLLLIRQNKEALQHLKAAKEEALQNKNRLALYFALGGLAYYHFLEGNLLQAHEMLLFCSKEMTDTGIVRQYSSPWIMEMIFEMDRQGLSVIPEMNFTDEFKRIMNDPNIHLRGVALRLRAQQKKASGADPGGLLRDLLESEAYLKESGDPVQLAKTRIDLAQLKLQQGKREEARLLAQKAREGLAGFWEEFFPDGLRFLLEPESFPADLESADAMLKRFLEMSEDFIPQPSQDDVLNQLLSAMNRFFMAERGGLFWFEDRAGKPPQLRASRNLSSPEVQSEGFRESLSLVLKCFREKLPLVNQPAWNSKTSDGKRILAILCLPFETRGDIKGVLYFDNSYLDNCFEFAKGPFLKHLKRFLASQAEKILTYSRMIEEERQAAIEKSAFLAGSNQQEFICRSEAMSRVLSKADRAAKSGASVLILGQTGVGKELLAHWIHQKSHRRQGPFIVVDPTVISEHLIESELFGHEKGAFTGADRQKPGRIELAQGGTLFIDEIGEIPVHLQSKFLRVLQEKTFVRVGGTKEIRSDFRLLAATNRDLLKEIKAGRFREDLYYRINVLDLTIPPLKDRPEDMLLLARHFLEIFSKRHQKPLPILSPEDERLVTAYTWPGNVRELKNAMERSVLLSGDDRLHIDLPSLFQPERDPLITDLPTLEELERRYICHVLEKTKGRVGGETGAAKLLGMKRTSLNSRMKRLGIRQSNPGS